MRLDDVTAVIRARRTWEAADLGVVLVRAWWRPILAAAALAYLPLLVLLAALLYRHPFVFAFAAWWFRPLLGAAVLHVVSRELFGERVSAGSLAAALPRAWSRRLLALLTWARPVPSRSITLPVWQLERLRGRRASERATLLAARTEAFLVVTGWSVCELGLLIGCLNLALVVAPVSPEMIFGDGVLPAGLPWLAAASATLVTSVIEVFSAAAGFGIYVNRRVQLEGWDLQLAFHRLAARLGAAREGTGTGRSLLLVLALSLAAVAPAAAQASDAAPPAVSHPEAGSPEAVAKHVLDAPPFARRKTVRTFRPRFKAPDRDERSAASPLAWLGSLIAALAWPVTILLGVAVVVAIAYAVLRRRAAAEHAGPAAADDAPAVVAGHDVRPESLPPDVGSAARGLWDAGRPIEALGLLYRASLARLIAKGIPLRVSSTEGECLRAARRALAAEPAAYFAGLTAAWQGAAYAHRLPGDDEGHALAADWNRHFGEVA